MENSKIEKIKEVIAQNDKGFILTKDAEQDESQANFQFVGVIDGKEVVFDAFIYTLEMEYFSNLYEDAIEMVTEKHPEYSDADFEALEGPHIDAMEEIASQLAKEDEYEVQEFVEIDEEDVTDKGMAMDICLNVPEIDENVIKTFINKFNTDSLDLDETFYSFDVE